jgi:tRNA(Ile)-lysidine synthase
MRPSRGRLVRPLLGVSRAEVLRYLATRGLGWREDASNADAAFRRNRVRHELLPLLEARFNPRVREGLARSAAVVADEAALLERLARRRAAGIVREVEGVVVVNRAALVRAPRALRRLVLRQALARAGGLRGVSAAHVERLLALAERKDSSGRRLPLPGRREARVVFGEIELGPAKASSAPVAFALPLGVPGRVALPDGRTLVAEPAPGPGVSNEKAAVVALGAASLEVRTRRPGDRVRVRGRELSLKRFLADRRVEAGAREALPLVAAGSHVLFVPGLPVESPPGARYVKLSLEGPASR